MKNTKNYLYHRLVEMETYTSAVLGIAGYEYRITERQCRGRKRDMGLVYCVMKSGKERRIRIPLWRGWKRSVYAQIRILRLRFKSDEFEAFYQDFFSEKRLRNSEKNLFVITK